jgi:hypothetical protein
VEIITGIATVVLVVITGVYVYFTWRLLKVTNQPEIVVSLRPHEAHINVVMLYVENVGTGVARKVRFTGDLSSSFDGKTALSDIGFIKNGIDVLGPGQKIQHFLASALEKWDLLNQASPEIIVTYKGPVKHKYKRTFHLNFAEWKGTATIGEPPLFELAKIARKIQKDLHSLVTGSSKPIVRTESLSKYRIRQEDSFLEKRMARLPDEVQEEILQEVEIIISKREQGVGEGEQNEQTATENPR